RTIDAKSVDQIPSRSQHANVPHIAGFMVLRVEFDDLKRLASAHILEQKQPYSSGVPAKQREIHPDLVQMDSMRDWRTSRIGVAGFHRRINWGCVIDGLHKTWIGIGAAHARDCQRLR